jgi:hypothetical protein
MNGNWIQKGNLLMAFGHDNTTYWIYPDCELIIQRGGRCERIVCGSRLRALGTAERDYQMQKGDYRVE